MGSAFNYSEESICAGYMAGYRIAKKDAILVTGATTGVPYAAALGAQEGGGTVIGISPGDTPEEHFRKYAKPFDALNAIIYTAMGYNGREPIIIASCDTIIYIGGEFGTLIEFGQGIYEGKILGVLTGVGGISDKLRTICNWVNNTYNSKVIYSSDPVELVDEVVELTGKNDRTARRIFPHTGDIGKDVRETLKKNKNRLNALLKK